MEVFKEYLLQNWPLILILMAFAIMLMITVFLDKRTIVKMYILIAAIFVLSICVFTEFYLSEKKIYPVLRTVLIAIRYSFTPVIIAFILLTLVKRSRWTVVLPAVLLSVTNIISIFNGMVFSLDENGEMVRGNYLGYLPYVATFAYSIVLVYTLIKQSNKQASEIIPIIYLAFALGTGTIFPFVIGKEYSKIFATTIAVAVFVYYVFLILQLTKKDALTGLLNRQAYYASIRDKKREITAVISIDMNGLKPINDNFGHIAGDEAISSLALCFSKAVRAKQRAYRIGGDEFVILCFKTSEEELKELIERINDQVSKTKYSCSIGYSYDDSLEKDIENMVKISDEMMYAKKAEYYSNSKEDRRKK